MRKYEIMYIVDQDAKDLPAISKKLNDILIANGGKIVESAEWGLKDFSYEINHKKKGYYFIVITETTSENILEFQRISGIDKDVVRTLVLNTESEKRYVQTTKLSTTDMSKYKEEKKPRTFEKRFNRNDNNSDDFKKEAPANVSETPVKEEAKVAPKPQVEEEAKPKVVRKPRVVVKKEEE